MSLTTIEYTTSADLFGDADPIGLQREQSARTFQIELRKRLKDRFPKANVFLKWNPNKTGPAEVFTLPDEKSTENSVVEIATALKAERDAWLSYDESIRAAF